MSELIEKYFLTKGFLVEDRVIREIEKRGGIDYLEKIEPKLNFTSPIFTLKNLPVDNEFSIVKEFHLDGYPGVSNSFVDLFRDRYDSLSSKIRSRTVSHHFISIARAKNLEGRVDVIGTVSDISTSKKGYRIVELDDKEDRIKIILNPRMQELILQDEVIGVTGSLANDRKAIFADSIIRPEAEKHIETFPTGPKVLVVSDIHVGSKNFLHDSFMNMVDFVNSEPISYLIMNGDLVDGIGIYPDQEKELEIPDIIKQYKRLAELISLINRNVRVIVIPGNHDIVYPTEPQNPLPPEINNLFPPNVVSLSNPVWVDIGKRTFLLYHGTSIMDFLESMPGTSLNDSDKVMKEMLKRSHIAPIYGKNLSFIPLKRDFYVMDPVPDVFITGHIHDHSASTHKGIITVNASTFQAQTDYQKMMNFNPKPSIGTMINTSDLSFDLVKF